LEPFCDGFTVGEHTVVGVRDWPRWRAREQLFRRCRYLEWELGDRDLWGRWCARLG
jgi:hypothetical protein